MTRDSCTSHTLALELRGKAHRCDFIKNMALRCSGSRQFDRVICCIPGSVCAGAGFMNLVT